MRVPDSTNGLNDAQQKGFDAYGTHNLMPE